MPARTFEQRLTPDWPVQIFLRRLIICAFTVHVALATISGVRAWVQIQSLDLNVSSKVIAPGSWVDVTALTSGRVGNQVTLELIQTGHRAILADVAVPENENFFYDPRSRRAEFSVRIGRSTLANFHAGTATIMVIATGRSQFLRIPPPEVRRVAVDLSPGGNRH